MAKYRVTASLCLTLLTSIVVQRVVGDRFFPSLALLVVSGVLVLLIALSLRIEHRG